jgi:hypothetical protein
MTAIVWKEKRKVYMLTNMHNPLAEGNLVISMVML